jgi:hypothetical protein
MRPEPTPLDSFLRFVLGFFVFIGVSFGVTYGVTVYTAQQTAAANQATALQALLDTAPKDQ